MLRAAVSTVIVLFISIGSAWAVVFEARGAKTDHWDVLDITGTGTVRPAQDWSCPPGYGPDVLRVRAGTLFGLAKGAVLKDGVYVALYRELSKDDEDADGVIMVGAQYGADIGVEHNVKIMRPHLWLEQDNDFGFQFKTVDGQGHEKTAASKAGYGLVTDSWNLSGWVWQKVRVEGDQIRAKYWSGSQPEPADWALEATCVLPGDRFGFKVNSGDINLAYFAADAADIPITPPANHLFLAMARAPQSGQIPLILLTNASQRTQETVKVVVEGAEGSKAEASLALEIPEGHGRHDIVLTTTAVEAGIQNRVSLSAPLGAGPCLVRLVLGDGTVLAETRFDVLPTEAMKRQMTDADSRVAILDGILIKNPEGPHRADIRILRDVVRAHVQNARTLFAEGRMEESGRAIRFAREALAEFTGFKGGWLRTYGADPAAVSLESADVSPKRAPSGRAASGKPLQDAYSVTSRITVGRPKLEAQALVMGRSYACTVPWTLEGTTPPRNYRFLVVLESPLGKRVAAQSDAAPEPPSSQWQPGTEYPQRVSLAVSPENPPEQMPLSRPVVLDEYHNLLVRVTDPETGAAVILGNPPGPQDDRPGASFWLDEVYVSSAPIEIREFVPPDSVVKSERTEHALFRNVGADPVEATAVLTITNECGHMLSQLVAPVTLPPSQDTPLNLAWTPQVAGTATVRIELLRDGNTLTEARHEVNIGLPSGCTLAIEKANHVNDNLRTPITIRANRTPFSVDIRAAGRQVGLATASQPTISLDAEPWFGYYDVSVDLGDCRYERRIVATVVEAKGSDLLVNGEPFIVKGVNVHGMDPGSPERTRSMMRIMRDLGFNMWRGDFPPRWQIDLAYEMNTAYTVLGPFSCASTAEVFERQDGPPMATARELSRLVVQRYADSAGTLLWNSCNEIVGETADFLLTLYPVYKALDPYARPVHYANLYGQDFARGQDVMGINTYFGAQATAASRQPMIARSMGVAKTAKLPIIFCEFNSFAGAVPSMGVDAMRDLYAWGVGKGMAGGFQYMKIDSDRHPGVFDDGFNTHRIYDDAIRKALADAEVTLTGVKGTTCSLHIANKRRCTLRAMRLSVNANDSRVKPVTLADLAPTAAVDVDVAMPNEAGAPGLVVEGELAFVTHFGFQCRVPFRLPVRP